MTDNTEAERVRNLVRAMTRTQKDAFLRSRNWRRVDGTDLWESANGFRALIGNACRLQALSDIEHRDA